MLEVRDLEFDYPDKRLLNQVRFTVPPGGVLHIQGGNGVGKTTLLQLLAGLLLPTEGDICYQGRSIADDRQAYQRTLCYVGHKTGVSRMLTVREQLRFELGRGWGTASFDEVATSFGLDGLLDSTCGLLSVGQRRRVGLLRLVLSEASLWLLDEPLVGLDQEAEALLMACVTKHLLQKGLVVMTSHQPLPYLPLGYQEYSL